MGNCDASCNMPWLLTIIATMTKMGVSSESTKIWCDDVDQSRTDAPRFFVKILNAELDHAGYITPTGMSDSLIASFSMYEATSQVDDYFKVHIRGLYEVIVSTFVGEEVLKEKVKLSLWSPLFNTLMTLQSDRTVIVGKVDTPLRWGC